LSSSSKTIEKLVPAISKMPQDMTVDPVITKHDKLILDFVIKGLHSTDIVEEEGFIQLIKGSNNSCI
jgi:hypothetical protein